MEKIKELSGGLENVNMFKYAAIECGIRYENRLDFSLIYSDKPCWAAGVFTTNKFCAAPVILCRERIKNTIHAVVINATNANAATGKQGYDNAKLLAAELAKILSIDEKTVLMASTGIIGVQLPVEKMKNNLPILVKNLNSESGKLLPTAIMTTDTFPKQYALSFETSTGIYTIAGIAKGAGMIAPDMATLLCFVVTDFPLQQRLLQKLFTSSIAVSLNAITIDGDMSTNDTAILLSPAIHTKHTHADIDIFNNALTMMMKRLAYLIVSDAEGATKCVTIKVVGAANDSDAKIAAKSIAESLLVKTAIFGNDPNWGRIACAAGYSGAELREDKLSIYFEDISLFKNGSPVNFDKDRLIDILKRKEYTIIIDFGIGKSSFEYLTSDLSYEYVKINAEYST
ncbi:MAG TPA: bifunctional glutamate N-acetyltransferase/amino-acid acetyltransferase ArgJ [Spirochaetota bacterium]|nr:bifunctional glutamate N-acetyltransferase/amino-acid acetyltransferase ArgJ [Spirochaetota bacterium]